MRALPSEWTVRDKNRFLFALMEGLAGDAQISFEGDLKKLRLLDFPGASVEESAVLKRNTIWPKQEFVVLPLEYATIRQIIAGIGGSIPSSILHIQIAKDGKLELGAYDGFVAMAFGDAITQEFLESLAAAGLLRRIET